MTLPGDWGLSFLGGQVDYDVASYVETDKHVHWLVGLSKSWQGIDWSLTYEDTDLEKTTSAMATTGVMQRSFLEWPRACNAVPPAQGGFYRRLP
jgi:sugar/nucleoside kinase (ribokinase family)